MTTWLSKWEPENLEFWRASGRKIAWQTLIVTTFTLVLSFTTWFAISALVVRMPHIGFKYTSMQLFWLTAMPGLAGGTLRILHMFLIPLFGTRHVITFATLLKLIPCVGIGLAVMNPQTPFWVFLLLAFSAGFGGGDFSSFMPSTSLFFPKRLQGTALAVQAGIGNFGVSLVQFVTPWIIGFTAFGGTSQIFAKGEIVRPVWLQNAVFCYVPLLVVGAFAAWIWLRSVPVRASVLEQLDIFSNRHTWIMTLLYLMTFGSFSGFAAAFPLLISSVYGQFPDAPDPLKFAFLGPLVGSLARVIAGPISDRFGGAIVTHYSGVGLLACAIGVAFFVNPLSIAEFPYFVTLMLGIFFFSGIGNASVFKQVPILFSHSPRQGGGVLGWIAAVAAYGPFIFSLLLGAIITQTGSALPFFVGVALFYAFSIGLNWFCYARRFAETRY